MKTSVFHDEKFYARICCLLCAVFALTFAVSCGGGGGGGGAVGGTGTGESSSLSVALSGESFSGGTRNAARSSKSVWEYASSIELNVFIDGSHIYSGTVTQANNSVKIEDVPRGSFAEATAVVTMKDGTTTTASGSTTIVVGENLLTLYLVYNYTLNDPAGAPIASGNYTSDKGITFPTIHGSLPVITWTDVNNPAEVYTPTGGAVLVGNGNRTFSAAYGIAIDPDATRTLYIHGDPGADQTTWTVLPAGTTVTWTSSNDAVAHVDPSGTITAGVAGTATITATAADGRTASAVITVADFLTTILSITDSGVVECIDASYSGNLILPAAINDITVTALADSAFATSTGLTGITLPAGITTIPSSAFSGCSNLTSVTMPGVTSISGNAFFNCQSLATIDLSGVTSIGEAAFKNSGLTSVTIPDSITAIEDSTFEHCADLTSVNLNNVTTVGFNAFLGCGFTSIDLSNVTTIAQGAFAYSGLTSVSVPADVTFTGEMAFAFCDDLTTATVQSMCTSMFRSCISLQSVTIGTHVTLIGSSAFASCSALTTVNYEGGVSASHVTTIGGWAFDGASSLTSIDIPPLVTDIQTTSFRSQCTSINCYAATPPTIVSGSFNRSTTNVRVPSGSLAAYQANALWNGCASLVGDL